MFIDKSEKTPNNKLGRYLSPSKNIITSNIILLLIGLGCIYLSYRISNPDYIVVKNVDSIEVVRDHKVDTMYIINHKYSSYDNKDKVGDTLWIKK